MKKLILGALALAIVIVGISAAMPVQMRPQPASATQTFDHSNCQYPDRWTNPADGCDNSDPAVPECIKAFSTEQGEKDCIAYYAAQHPTTPIVEQPKPAQPQAAQCGGK